MENFIYGLNPVISALQGKRRPKKVLISETLKNKDVEKLCKENGIPFQFSTRKELDRITNGANNQGVVCYIDPFEYTSLRELLSKVSDDSLLLVLDGIEDPVNFGSLLRTSCCFGVDGVIIGKDRQVGMTPTVIKLSTGASEHIDVVQVSNVAQTINELKKNGYWIKLSYTTKVRTKAYKARVSVSELNMRTMAIVVGSEGRGVSRLVLERSDFVARIPISGPVTSLNAAIAGAIFLSAAASFRNKK